MAIQEVKVTPKEPSLDSVGQNTFKRLSSEIGSEGLEAVRTAKVYWLEGVSPEQADSFARRLLADPVAEDYQVNPLEQPDPKKARIGYHRFMTDPWERTALESARRHNLPMTAFAALQEFKFEGDLDDLQTHTFIRSLYNPTIKEVVAERPESLVVEGESQPVMTILLRDAGIEELRKISTVTGIHCDDAKMLSIQNYFRAKGRDPRDIELQHIGAAWSDHCVHETFNAKVILNGQVVESMFPSIKRTSQEVEKGLVISKFGDNSGVMTFYDGFAINMKGETHNSPSEMDPANGAGTGVGGILRDNVMTGQGGQAMLVVDHFGVALNAPAEKMPPGVIEPDIMLRGLVEGTGGYGNPIGVPTRGGTTSVDNQYLAKPTDLIVCYGLMKEKDAQKGRPQPGDRILVIGGKTGADGIHGATFSSVGMSDEIKKMHSAAVQVGDPITQHAMFKVIEEATKRGIIRALTDFGAAGFGSAFGELGKETGLRIDLSKAPKKHKKLRPWEEWVSESQERAAVVVAPEHEEEFLQISRELDNEATDMGYFTDDHKLVVTDGDEVILDLEYDFLENGLPQQTLEAEWHKPEPTPVPEAVTDWEKTVTDVLSFPEVASRQLIDQQYDWGVKAMGVIEPYTGKFRDTPVDATVLTPLRGKPYGFIASSGINPRLHQIDPYQASISVATEAMSNLVAVGGDPDQVAWVNNYISGKASEKWVAGALKLCVDGVNEAMRIYQTEVCSGKDSCSSSKRLLDGTEIHVSPYVAISAGGRIPDVSETVTPDLKYSNSVLCLVGEMDPQLGGSVFYKTQETLGSAIPQINPETTPQVLRRVHEAIKSGQVLACKDIGRGGLISTLAAMGFGSNVGVEFAVPENYQKPEQFIFNETPGSFVVELQDELQAHELFDGVPFEVIGKTTSAPTITAHSAQSELFSLDIDQLKTAWKTPMERIFG